MFLSCSALIRVLIIAATLSSLIISSYGYQNAFACSYSRLTPEEYYERSDVIFVGRVTSIDAQPLDGALYVTFNVSKSWKGVDTKIVTIRNGDGISCSGYGFWQDREHLVYGTKDFFSINVGFSSGTTLIDSSSFISDLTFLENNHTPRELKTGHTMSISPFLIMTIIGSLGAVSIAAFVILKKRA